MDGFYLKPVVSYTTREKREKETDGVEHYFITPEEAKIKLKTEHILAYTEINGIEYFSTIEALNDSNLYIIDPKGIRYIKDHFPKLKIKVIYIMTDNNIRLQRAKLRDNKDFINNFEKRNLSEDDQFTEFEKLQDWDLLLINNNGRDCIESFLNYILSISEKDPTYLYLVAGRTGSGKDFITSEAIKILRKR